MVLDGGDAGSRVALEARRLVPSMPILFVSGYDQDHGETELVEVGAELLEKPFTRTLLVNKVAQMLLERGEPT